MPRGILAGLRAPVLWPQGRKSTGPAGGLIGLFTLGLLLTGSRSARAQGPAQVLFLPDEGQKTPPQELQLAPPRRAQVFRAEPENLVLERIRREAAERGEKAQ